MKRIQATETAKQWVLLLVCLILWVCMGISGWWGQLQQLCGFN